MLPGKFKQPAEFQWGAFINTKGAKIRYGRLVPAGAVKGSLVLVTGFRECIEKYFEVVQDLTAKGFVVWVMDWRGQGGSDRYLAEAPQKMHSEGYAEQIETLHQFATKIVDQSGGPLVLFAHSMGAHIGLRFLNEHEGVFDSAVLTAPMLDIATGGVPKPVARQLARLARLRGTLEKYVPGGADWDTAREPFTGNVKTSDRERFGVVPEIYAQKPELKMGDPTYGWLWHTFQSIDVLNRDDYLAAIKTPIFMQVSGKDAVVDNAALENAVSILPCCTRLDVPEAKHEIWMEREDLRSLFLRGVFAFLEAGNGAVPRQNKSFTPPAFG